MIKPNERARLFQADLGKNYDPQRPLEFLRLLEEENKGKAPARNLAQLFQAPPVEDVLLQTIYETPFVRGDIVLAGRRTRELHPLTQYHPVHFRKTYLEKMAGWESPTTLEERQTQMVWNHFEEEGHGGKVPKALGCTPEEFRSELIQAKTIGALSPIHNSANPKEIAEQIRKARKNPSDIRKLWEGLDAVREAMSVLHQGGMLHKDAHRENLMISYSQAGHPTGHIIDFETSEEDERFATPDWKRATFEDCQQLIEESTLVFMCSKPGEIPKELTENLLAREVNAYAQVSPKILAVRQILAEMAKQSIKSPAPAKKMGQEPEIS